MAPVSALPHPDSRGSTGPSSAGAAGRTWVGSSRWSSWWSRPCTHSCCMSRASRTPPAGTCPRRPRCDTGTPPRPSWRTGQGRRAGLPLWECCALWRHTHTHTHYLSPEEWGAYLSVNTLQISYTYIHTYIHRAARLIEFSSSSRYEHARWRYRKSRVLSRFLFICRECSLPRVLCNSSAICSIKACLNINNFSISLFNRQAI